MDFDIAARRLERDQKSALARSRASRNARTASSKAKKEAQLARAKAERRLKAKKVEVERNARIADRIVRDVGRAERGLGVVNVSPSSPAAAATSTLTPPLSEKEHSSVSLFAKDPQASGWKFVATSIHGEGDKIALPPSVLETMTSDSKGLDPWGSGRQNGRPIAFRVGILNPNYSFPSSEKMKALVDYVKQEIVSSETDAPPLQSPSIAESSDNNGTKKEAMDESDDEADDSRIIEAYLDELSHRYLSYTHGTVVEFTQENDCVGLPESIARALIRPNSHSLVGNASDGRNNDIPVRRTVDPSSVAVAENSKDIGDDKDAMDIDTNSKAVEEMGVIEKTPGHPAYGLFDIPALPIEVIPINSLPPGKNCTFTPTASSIKNGFYALKDVKVVLEQSLMRTRATLSRGDVIRTWRRGVSFDLIVSSLSPAEYGVVSCVNTDLNVDIGPPDDDADGITSRDAEQSNDAKNEPKSITGGRLLSEPPAKTKFREPAASSTNIPKEPIELPPEPAENRKDGVCNIQIRGRAPSGSSAAGRRRFDIARATMGDLFAFASHVCDGSDPSSFRLVTRFPRRVFALSFAGEEESGCFVADATLENAGIGQGQELFMIESV
mmetsp:Transcript_39782/g.95734  ORF Transcript_39782/g.95734 Transcript_39782/m.95734 type:complete len:611 (-) Transcript_39782:299-2131(-)